MCTRAVNNHTFFVFGNLNPGARGPTAAATSKQAEESGVGGVEPCELPLPLLLALSQNNVGFTPPWACGVVLLGS